MRRRETPHERRVNRMLRELREEEYRAAVRRQRERDERDRRIDPWIKAAMILYGIGLIVWMLWWS